MLIGMDDVRAVSIEQARHCGHQAFAVRTVNQENRGVASSFERL
jgi:hypothetical protein